MPSTPEERPLRRLRPTIVEVKAHPLAFANNLAPEHAIATGEPLDIRNAGRRQRGRERKLAKLRSAFRVTQDAKQRAGERADDGIVSEKAESRGVFRACLEGALGGGKPAQRLRDFGVDPDASIQSEIEIENLRGRYVRALP